MKKWMNLMWDSILLKKVHKEFINSYGSSEWVTVWDKEEHKCFTRIVSKKNAVFS